MSVVAEGADGDVGRVYILLIDPDSGEVTAQTEAASNSGQYQFQFANIAPGSYQLSAGSDSDNDLFICDAGEAPLITRFSSTSVQTLIASTYPLNS
jgi:serine protease